MRRDNDRKPSPANSAEEREMFQRGLLILARIIVRLHLQGPAENKVWD